MYKLSQKAADDFGDIYEYMRFDIYSTLQGEVQSHKLYLSGSVTSE